MEVPTLPGPPTAQISAPLLVPQMAVKCETVVASFFHNGPDWAAP